MNKPAVFLLSFAFFLAAANVFSFGAKENDSVKLQAVEASGRVRLVGTDLIRSLVISGEDREWHIAEEEQEKLMHLQQQIVTVKANEYYYDRFYANGLPAKRQYYLKDITVISPR